MDGGNYKSVLNFTWEKAMASLLVITWVALAFSVGGLPLALRAALLFSIPLTAIWIPEWMAGLAGIASRKSLAENILVTPVIIKIVGWLLILGVPASWFLLSQAARR